MIVHVIDQAMQVHIDLGWRRSPGKRSLQLLGCSKQITMFRVDLAEKYLVLITPSEMRHNSLYANSD